jgi:hypothetical protein
MSKSLLHATRLTLFSAFVLWLLFALGDRDGATTLLERTVSPDGHIPGPNHAVWEVGAILLTLTCIMMVGFDRWHSALADLARGSRWTERSEVLLVSALVLVHIVRVVQHYSSSSYVGDGIYAEDGPLEYLSVLLAIGAATLLLIGLPRADRRTQIVALLVAIVAIIFAGEEISWGQRIFGFESTGAFFEANYQRETNLHNFFNPALEPIFMLLNFAVTIWMLNARVATRWLVKRVGCADIQPLVNPRNNLILGGLMVGPTFSLGIHGSELSEEVLAAMLFYGSLRFMLARRAP